MAGNDYGYDDAIRANGTVAAASVDDEAAVLTDQDLACLHEFRCLSEALVLFVARKRIQNTLAAPLVLLFNGTPLCYDENASVLQAQLKAMMQRQSTCYCLMPVCESDHWTLFAFIVSGHDVRVLHFDSDRPELRARSVVSTVLSVLEPLQLATPRESIVKVVAMPRQSNWYDSGLHVLAAIHSVSIIVGAVGHPSPVWAASLVETVVLTATSVLKPLSQDDVLDTVYEQHEVPVPLYVVHSPRGAMSISNTASATLEREPAPSAEEAATCPTATMVSKSAMEKEPASAMSAIPSLPQLKSFALYQRQETRHTGSFSNGGHAVSRDDEEFTRSNSLSPMSTNSIDHGYEEPSSWNAPQLSWDAQSYPQHAKNHTTFNGLFPIQREQPTPYLLGKRKPDFEFDQLTKRTLAKDVFRARYHQTSYGVEEAATDGPEATVVMLNSSMENEPASTMSTISSWPQRKPYVLDRQQGAIYNGNFSRDGHVVSRDDEEFTRSNGSSPISSSSTAPGDHGPSATPRWDQQIYQQYVKNHTPLNQRFPVQREQLAPHLLEQQRSDGEPSQNEKNVAPAESPMVESVASTKTYVPVCDRSVDELIRNLGVWNGQTLTTQELNWFKSMKREKLSPAQKEALREEAARSSGPNWLKMPRHVVLRMFQLALSTDCDRGTIAQLCNARKGTVQSKISLLRAILRRM